MTSGFTCTSIVCYTNTDYPSTCVCVCVFCLFTYRFARGVFLVKCLKFTLLANIYFKNFAEASKFLVFTSFQHNCYAISYMIVNHWSGVQLPKLLDKQRVYSWSKYCVYMKAINTTLCLNDWRMLKYTWLSSRVFKALLLQGMKYMYMIIIICFYESTSGMHYTFLWSILTSSLLHSGSSYKVLNQTSLILIIAILVFRCVGKYKTMNYIYVARY